MKSPEIEELKRLVKEKYEDTLATSTDFEVFSLMLKNKYNANVSTSTLKRLYDYVGDEHKPRMTTLNALARYIGHPDFSRFVAWLKTSPCYNSSFFDADQLMSSDLHRGDEVEIGWSPNRMVRLEYLGNSRYTVIESRDSKMLFGDIFVTGCFIAEQPLYLPFLERGGEHTPPFVAGRNGGLSIVRILKTCDNE